MAWIQAILAFFGLASKAADIIKTNQDNAKRDRAEKQGEQNANAKSTADALQAVVKADHAASDPDIIKFVRERYERP